MVVRNHILYKNCVIINLINDKGNQMRSINQAIALRIEELLKQNNMTRYRLALKSGITHSTLKNIMNDTIKDNLMSTVILIANGFDIPVSEFLNSPLFNLENLDI